MNKKTKTKYKINIFDLLRRADAGEIDYYDSLTEEEKKGFQPWLVQRWISSKKLQLTNEITNPLIGNIPPELSWRLFCAIGVSGTKGYKFPITGRASTLKSDILLGLIAQHYRISRKLAKEYLPLLSKDDIINIAEAEGLDNGEIKKIRERLK